MWGSQPPPALLPGHCSAVPQTTKQAPFDPASPLLGKYPEEAKKRKPAPAVKSKSRNHRAPLRKSLVAELLAVTRVGRHTGPSGGDRTRTVTEGGQHGLQTREQLLGLNPQFLNCAQKYKHKFIPKTRHVQFNQ